MLLAPLRQLIANQLDAALSTMNACVRGCPPALWEARVGALTFDQVAFHALFFTDYYLGPDEASFRGQPFHREHATSFCDYEEFEDRAQAAHYGVPFLLAYLPHCRTKAAEVMAAETEQTLAGRCGFPRRAMSRAELYVYNTRHLQHHAAQLSLRLRLDAGIDIPWFGGGWRDT